MSCSFYFGAKTCKNACNLIKRLLLAISYYMLNAKIKIKIVQYIFMKPVKGLALCIMSHILGTPYTGRIW